MSSEFADDSALEEMPQAADGRRRVERDAEEREAVEHEELFPEDTGTCPLAARHAIAALVKRRYISADEDRVAWDGLVAHEDMVRSRLCDMLLSLKVDVNAGIALAQQVELENDTVPYKIKSVNYFTNVQSLLITQLVTKYFAATSAGESVVWIETEEMLEYLRRLFEDAPDVAFTELTMNQAIGAMTRNGYLKEVGEGRYRIMPIIGVVYTLDEIKSVIERYDKSRRALAGEEERAGESDE